MLTIRVEGDTIEIKILPFRQINPAPYNPRIELKPGDEEYEKLKRSILEFGFVEPLIVNQRTGNIVGGHQRYRILKDLGRTEAECSVVDLDEAKEKALNIALNKISGSWDIPKLKDLLQEFDTSEFDIKLTGFDEDEIERLIQQCYEPPPASEDEFDIEQALESVEEPFTRPGEVWILGSHRLMCGDSTNQAHIEKLQNGELVDMVFTDPPYNVDYTGKTEDALKIANDHMSDGAFRTFLDNVYKNLFEASKPGAPIYVCHADSEGINFRSAMVDAGWLLKQCIIWVKQSFVMGRQDYHWKHEPILYGWKPGEAHHWYADRTQDTVWEFDRPARNAEHPTMKPIELVANAIQNSSKQGDIVLDLFGGSGSTLIAAEQLARRAYLCEMDPKYCDVIVERWEKFTGQKAYRQ